MQINIVNDQQNTTQYEFGTSGFDVFRVFGSASEYGYEATDDGGFVVWQIATGEFDILYNIEGLLFDDGAFSFSDGAFTEADFSEYETQPVGDVDAVDDTFAVEVDAPVVIDVLANDTNLVKITGINGEAMQAGWSTWIEGVGLVTVNEDNTLTVISAQPGPFSFTYTAQAADGTEVTSTVTGTSDPIGHTGNTGPVATDDAADFSDSEPVTVNVLENDNDSDGDSLSIVAVNGMKLLDGWSEYIENVGVIVNNGDGTLTLHPEPGITSASIDYTISDGKGGEDTATLELILETSEPTDPTVLEAEIVGDDVIWEGQAGSFRVQLNGAVSEDTVFAISTQDGSANRIDRDDYDVANQDVMWGGYFDYRYGAGGEIHSVIDNAIPNGTSFSDGYRAQVGPDGELIWDYTLFDGDRVAEDGQIYVLVKAGESTSESFHVQAWEEQLSVDRDSDFTAYNPGYDEGNETFSLHIEGVSSSNDQQFAGDGYLEVTIVNEGGIDFYSPIGIDLNNDGKIGVTGETTSQQKDADAELGRTVKFDIDADGSLDTIEWFDGSGDGILVDMSKINADGSIDGSALFGDQGGQFDNGYQKLSERDANEDGVVDGAELNGLGVWVDDGDAVLEAGELYSATEIGLTSVSTNVEFIIDDSDQVLMQSTAMVNNQQLLTEDVWFAAELMQDQHEADMDLENEITGDVM